MWVRSVGSWDYDTIYIRDRFNSERVNPCCANMESGMLAASPNIVGLSCLVLSCLVLRVKFLSTAFVARFVAVKGRKRTALLWALPGSSKKLRQMSFYNTLLFCYCEQYLLWVWWQYALLMATHGNWPRWGCEQAKPGWGGSRLSFTNRILFQFLFLYFLLWSGQGKKSNFRSNFLPQKVVWRGWEPDGKKSDEPSNSNGHPGVCVCPVWQRGHWKDNC